MQPSINAKTSMQDFYKSNALKMPLKNKAIFSQFAAEF